MNPSTMVTCRGWWDLADQALFYPDDLPEEWRLGYFANLFRATLLPADAWLRANPQQVQQWRDDVRASFRFVAERPPATTPAGITDPLSPSSLIAGLGAQLNGWIAPIPPPPATTETRAAVDPCLAYDQQHAGTDRSPAGSRPAYAVVAPAELHRNLRASRSWLDQLNREQGRPPSLVILRQPRSSDLNAWQDLLELLGLG
jgi:hypothetical protein